MKDELENELCKKYPKIFKDARHPDPTVTCMHWGIAVGDGWYTLLNSGCSLIQNHIEWARKKNVTARWYNRAVKRALAGNTESLRRTFLGTNDGVMTKWQQNNFEEALENLQPTVVPEKCDQLVATQVKEKFGGLRFYYDGGDTYTAGIVDMMENMSNVTCDSCGAPGESGGRGWITVKCGPCRIGFKQSEQDYLTDDE